MAKIKPSRLRDEKLSGYKGQHPDCRLFSGARSGIHISRNRQKWTKVNGVERTSAFWEQELWGSSRVECIDVRAEEWRLHIKIWDSWLH